MKMVRSPSPPRRAPGDTGMAMSLGDRARSCRWMGTTATGSEGRRQAMVRAGRGVALDPNADGWMVEDEEATIVGSSAPPVGVFVVLKVDITIGTGNPGQGIVLGEAAAAGFAARNTSTAT